MGTAGGSDPYVKLCADEGEFESRFKVKSADDVDLLSINDFGYIEMRSDSYICLDYPTESVFIGHNSFAGQVQFLGSDVFFDDDVIIDSDALLWCKDSAQFDGYLDLSEISTPSNAPADKLRFYVKNNAGTTHFYVKDSAGTETNISEKLGPDFPQRMTWYFTPTYNGLVEALGWYIQTDAAASVTSAVPLTVSEPGFNSHFAIDISSPVGLPFTVRITGRSVNEVTGVETPGDTEDIYVPVTTIYQSLKTWVDAVQISIVEASKSFTADVYRTAYWDKAGTDFTIEGCSLEWKPDSATWDINFHLFYIDESGATYDIDDVTFASTDGVLRADNTKPGKYKRGNYNQEVRGSLNEGIIVEVDQTGIEHFFMEVTFRE